MAAAGAAGRKAPSLPRVSGTATQRGDVVKVTVMLPHEPNEGQVGRLVVEKVGIDGNVTADDAVLLESELVSKRFVLGIDYEDDEVFDLSIKAITKEGDSEDEEEPEDDGDMAEYSSEGSVQETTHITSFDSIRDDFAPVMAALRKHAYRVHEAWIDEDDIGLYGAHTGAVGTNLLRAPTLDQESTADAAERITRQLQREKKRSADEVVNRFVAHDRCFVDEAGRRALMARVDAVVVDDQADTKLVLTVAELEAVVGAAAVAKMQEAFGVSIDEVKLRRVSATPEREVINFHLDFAHRTMGIPLNDSTEYEGSRLLYAIPGEGVVAAPRGKAGSATVHDNTLPHGVTPLTHGVRYGLFLLNHTA